MTKPQEFLVCAHCNAEFKRDWKRQKYCSATCALFSRVTKSGEDDCWLWRGSQNNMGYGGLRIDKKHVYAHRLSAILAGVDLASDDVIIHMCDTPLCCNPKHLRIGTQAENLEDMRLKGRGSAPPVLRGERANGVRLTPENVQEIRQAFREGMGEVQISRKFSVSPSHAGRINRREVWKHLP